MVSKIGVDDEALGYMWFNFGTDGKRKFIAGMQIPERKDLGPIDWTLHSALRPNEFVGVRTNAIKMHYYTKCFSGFDTP